jgi:hypothetical protein
METLQKNDLNIVNLVTDLEEERAVNLAGGTPGGVAATH